jgi:hypothetical protein
MDAPVPIQVVGAGHGVTKLGVHIVRSARWLPQVHRKKISGIMGQITAVIVLIIVSPTSAFLQRGEDPTLSTNINAFCRRCFARGMTDSRAAAGHPNLVTFHASIEYPERHHSTFSKPTSRKHYYLRLPSSVKYIWGVKPTKTVCGEGLECSVITCSVIT